jgi:hypothetical protein
MPDGTSCEACRFYCTWSDDIGECRRRAPTAITLNRREIGDPEDLIAGWPTVQAGDWCGEFEAPHQTSTII